MTSSAAASAVPSRGALFVDYLRRLEAVSVTDGDVVSGLTPQQQLQQQQQQQQAIRLMCQLVCDTGAGTGDAESVGWSVLASVWEDAVCPRLAALQALLLNSSEPSAAAASAAVATGDGSKPAARGARKQQHQGGGGGRRGGPLPAAQAAALERARQVGLAQQKLLVLLQALTALAAWMAEQRTQVRSGAASSSVVSSESGAERVALLQRILAGTLQLLRAEFSSSHSAAVGVVFALSQLGPSSLQQQLRQACLDVLMTPVASPANATAAASPASPFSLSAAHPRSLCMLLTAFLPTMPETTDENDVVSSERLWAALLQTLQSNVAAVMPLRQQLLRSLVPLLVADTPTSAAANKDSASVRRLQQLLALYREQWGRAMQHLGHPSEPGACDLASLSPFAPCPFLQSGFLDALVTAQPALAHLLDVLCVHYPAMHAATLTAAPSAGSFAATAGAITSLDTWLREVVLSGLSSAQPLHKKQALYLLQARLALRERWGEHNKDEADDEKKDDERHQKATANEDEDEWTGEQWACFQQLFQTLEGTSLHLVQSVFPRLSLLFNSRKKQQMAPWLELLVLKAVLHPTPSIASAAFQHIDALCRADSAREHARVQQLQQQQQQQSASTPLCAGNSSASLLRPPILRPAVVLGPVLQFFDDPSLFGSDPQRNGLRRVGDTLLGPFLLDFIHRLPLKRSPDPADIAATTTTTRAEFLRAFLRHLSSAPSRGTRLSVNSLAVQMRALAETGEASSPCLDGGEADLTLLLTLMQGRLATASGRLRSVLTLSMLQLFARQVDFSACTTPASTDLIARMMQQFPEKWLRPNCAALALLQQELHLLHDASDADAHAADGSDSSWVARHVQARFDQLFDRLNASIAIPSSEEDAGSSGDAHDDNCDSRDGGNALLLSEGADMHSVHEGLLRLLFLVRGGSTLERRLLDHWSQRWDESLALAREADVRSNVRAGMAMLQLLHLLSAFFATFARSEQDAAWAANNSQRPERESVQCPETACSVKFLNERERTRLLSPSSSASAASSEPAAGALTDGGVGGGGWSVRVSWSARLLSSRAWLCVHHLSAMVTSLSSRATSTVQALKISSTLLDVLGEVLAHSSTDSTNGSYIIDIESSNALRRMKQQLLANALSVLTCSQCFALPAVEDRAFIWGLVRACVVNIASSEFEAEAGAVDEKEEEQLVVNWTSHTLHGSRDPWDTSVAPLPLALASWLLPRLVSVAQLQARKPAGLTAAQWKGVVQRFYLARWQAVRHLLSVVPSAIRVRLAPNMLEQCVDALDGSTEHFVEEVFHSVRLLMGPYVTSALQQQRSDAPQPQAPVLSTLDRVYQSSWSAFKDLQGGLPSFEAVLAFLGVVFEATATNAALLPGNHVAANSMAAAEREGAQGPFRRILTTLLDYGLHHARFLLYVSFFCSAMWLQQPTLLTGYVDEVLMLCLFRASADAELELVEEKVRAFELAHMIHAFSETTRAVGAGEGAGAAAVTASAASASAPGASSSTLLSSSSSSAAATIAALGASNTASAKEVVKSDGLHRAESLVRCVALHMLQMLPSVLASLSDNDDEDGRQTREFIEVFLLSFVRACTSHPSMQNEKGAMLGEGNDEFVRKLYLWQTLCIVVPSVRAMQVGSERRKEMHKHLASHAWAWFDRALTTVLRQQLELFLVQLYAAAPPERVVKELAPRIEQYLPRPTLLASVLLVLAFSTLSLLPASSPSSADAAASVDARVVAQQARCTLRLLHPFVGSNFGHVRLVVQYLYHRIMTEMLPAEEAAGVTGQQTSADSSIPSAIVAEEAASVQASFMRFLNSDPDMVRLRDRQRNYFAMFSPLACGATVQSLLAFGVEAHHFVQVAAMDAITGVQGAFLTSRRDHYDDRVFPAPNTVAIGGVQVPLAAAAATEAAPSARPAASSAGTGANFQQKIELAPLTQLAAMGDITQQSPGATSSSGGGAAAETDDGDDASGDSAGGGVRLRSAVEQRSSAARQSVIVVASFVSKLPNLAGLARTCEIFQSARLMLSDPASALANPDFTAVAVTAHRWLPIEKLAPEDVGAFMAARQAEGYTCVALEQSAQSISLPRYQMPRKLVIILGAEKEGVPVNILNAVDQCVEIPQLGIIRSLNVHVSASILLWEHRRQAILGLLAEE